MVNDEKKCFKKSCKGKCTKRFYLKNLSYEPSLK